MANPALILYYWNYLMAFQQNAAAVADTPSNDKWKAQGFLNFYLPSKTGGRKKLGAIPLRDSKGNEKQLLAWLNEDPSRVAKILASLEIEFQSALPADVAGFDLD
jgi:hypothetical protein